MQIKSVNNLCQQSFGALVYKKPVLKKLPKSVVNDVPKIEKELEATKHWDLVLGCIFEDTPTMEYVNKHDPKEVYLRSIKFLSINDKTISGIMGSILKIDIGDGLELDVNSIVDLEFKTKEQAEQSMEILKSYKYGSLSSAANIVKVLDSADKFVHDDEVMDQTS